MAVLGVWSFLCVTANKHHQQIKQILIATSGTHCKIEPEPKCKIPCDQTARNQSALSPDSHATGMCPCGYGYVIIYIFTTYICVMVQCLPHTHVRHKHHRHANACVYDLCSRGPASMPKLKAVADAHGRQGLS